MKDNAGLCDSVNAEIVLHDDLEGRELLEVAIHEGMHACFWDLDEWAIDESAKSLAEMLWKMGFQTENKLIGGD